MSRRHQSLRLVPERFDDEGSSGNKATGDKPLPPKRKPADVTDENEDEEIVDELDE